MFTCFTTEQTDTCDGVPPLMTFDSLQIIQRRIPLLELISSHVLSCVVHARGGGGGGGA